MMRRKFSIRYSWSLPSLIALGVVILVALYALSALSPLLRGPTLILNPPRATDHGTVLIEGVANRVSSLSINDLSVPTTQDGFFSVERAYPAGYTVVVVSARDRFNRETTATQTFVTHSSITYGTKEKSDQQSSN